MSGNPIRSPQHVLKWGFGMQFQLKSSQFGFLGTRRTWDGVAFYAVPDGSQDPGELHLSWLNGVRIPCVCMFASGVW